MFKEEVLQKVKEQNDIVDVVSETVRLKRAGRNYTGLCPFHNEKTPSFIVSRDKQIFKCFGCGEAGNVISFVMKTKRLTFPEAVRNLAERAGIDIEEEGYKGKSNLEGRKRFQRMYNLNVDAARYFYSNLRKNPTAYEYMKKRGMDDSIMKRFGLGFAQDGWHNAENYLRSKGYEKEEILRMGITTENQNGKVYDRFRNRIIFPVFDYSGKVIGFGGRVLDDSKPKYLNSPETPLFKKGTNLYGLNFAIKNMKDRTLILVEGYMDCISLHQRGITNVVASLGTALTEIQAKLIRKYADEVIVSYDSDVAGINATLRGLHIFKNEGIKIRVLTVPQGKDPDEYIKLNGRDSFQQLVENALPLIDFQLKNAEKGIDFSKREMVIKYIRNVSEILASVDPIEREVYLKDVSEKTGINGEVILETIKSININEGKNFNENPQVSNINVEIGQKLYLERAFLKAERTLIKLMIMDKEYLNYIGQKISVENFSLNSHKEVYQMILDNKDKSCEEIEKIITGYCEQDPDKIRDWINILELQVQSEDYDVKKYVEDCIKEVKKYQLEESKKDIMKKIKVYESKGMLEDSIKLAKKLIDIQKQIESYK